MLGNDIRGPIYDPDYDNQISRELELIRQKYIKAAVGTKPVKRGIKKRGVFLDGWYTRSRLEKIVNEMPQHSDGAVRLTSKWLEVLWTPIHEDDSVYLKGRMKGNPPKEWIGMKSDDVREATGLPYKIKRYVTYNPYKLGRECGPATPLI